MKVFWWSGLLWLPACWRIECTCFTVLAAAGEWICTCFIVAGSCRPIECISFMYESAHGYLSFSIPLAPPACWRIERMCLMHENGTRKQSFEHTYRAGSCRPMDMQHTSRSSSWRYIECTAFMHEKCTWKQFLSIPTVLAAAREPICTCFTYESCVLEISWTLLGPPGHPLA